MGVIICVPGKTKQTFQPWCPSIRHETGTFVGPPMPCSESRLEEICWSLDSPPSINFGPQPRPPPPPPPLLPNQAPLQGNISLSLFSLLSSSLLFPSPPHMLLVRISNHIEVSGRGLGQFLQLRLEPILQVFRRLQDFLRVEVEEVEDEVDS